MSFLFNVICIVLIVLSGLYIVKCGFEFYLECKAKKMFRRLSDERYNNSDSR